MQYYCNFVNQLPCCQRGKKKAFLAGTVAAGKAKKAFFVRRLT